VAIREVLVVEEGPFWITTGLRWPWDGRFANFVISK
jgi:hypothetical protein